MRLLRRVDPARVPCVDVNGGALCLEYPDRIVNEIQSLLLQRRTEASHAGQRVRLENHDRPPIAQARGESTYPFLVGVGTIGAPGRILAAVPARDVVGDKYVA